MGAALAVESAHPTEAEQHLREAERLLSEPLGYTSRVTQAPIKYQLAAVLGQQGNSAGAVTLYWEVLSLVRANDAALDVLRHIMLYNNLAYHLHLLGDPTAADYARAGIKLAQEKGSLSHLPYLLSTSGEIALARSDLDAAEQFFTEGLALAERVPMAERIAGLTANLALVARQRGHTAQAIERLRDALVRADALGAQHLSVRIRLWLAPLLAPSEARTVLRDARAIAERGAYRQLLDDITQLEQQLLPS